ncbi:MAG: hypothetical protein ACRCZF_21670, partial [Gemmataceae bacterium]
HDGKIAMAHYAQTTDEHFARAAAESTAEKCGAFSDARTAQKATQQVPAENRIIRKESSQGVEGFPDTAEVCDMLPTCVDSSSGAGGI